MAECELYPYDVTVELLKDHLEFKKYKFTEDDKTTLTEIDDKSLKWEIDGLTTAEEYDGTYKLTVCFGVKKGTGKTLGKVSTLKLIKPAINIGISGTAYCYDDDEDY